MPKHNPRRANGHRRTKLLERVRAEEDTCALCHRPVDKTLTVVHGKHGPRCRNPECIGCVPHPMRGEVDEIVPVTRGGDPLLRSNVQLTHRECNRRKGNSLPGDAVRPTRLPVPLSQQW